MGQITNVTNIKIKELIRLKKRPNTTLLIEGLHLIEMAYHANLLIELFTTTSLPYDKKTTLISANVAKKLSDKVTTDGHFALINKPQFTLDFTKPLLYLDDINDPGNMGTILRTALAFDFGGVIASRESVNFYNEKVLASAQGAHFLLPLKTADHTYLNELKREDYSVLVSDVRDGKRIPTVKQTKSVLVLGNEARGVSDEVKKQATHVVTIPIHHIESLNVAIAGALLMYELVQ